MEALIIGAGISGLTVGAILAKSGIKVTVVEQHYQIGGYAHNFKRRGYIWEAAVHTVPMARDGVVFSILDQLGIGANISTVEHSEMYRVNCAGKTYAVPSRREDIVNWFYSSFPLEREGLDKFFSDLEELHQNMFTLFNSDKRGYLDKDPEFGARFQGRSFKSYLDETFLGDDIKTVLSGQWPFVAITADQGAMLFLMMLFATHFFDGSHSVEGGFANMAKELADLIESAGGEVITRCEVSSIESLEKRVTRVTTECGRDFQPDIVVSTVSPYLLHSSLINEEGRSRRTIRRLSTLRPSLSAVIVYLGMKEGFADIVKGNVICNYDSSDLAKLYREARGGKLWSEDYLTVLNPTDYIGKPVLTLFTFADISASNSWKEDKVKVGEAMLYKLEELYPGITEFIEYREYGSPETFIRYTGNSEGALYGFENSSDLLREGKMGYTTHLKNLWQAGHWTIPGCGIYNVVTNGYTVAKEILSGVTNA